MNNTSILICSPGNPDKIVMTQRQIILVQRSWKIFREIKAEIVGDVFYSKLFTEMPTLQKMFKTPMPAQSKKLIDMISMVVGRLHNLDELTSGIVQMAKRHVGYGVKAAHYQLVGQALLWTLEQGLGNDWDEELKEAWTQCYKILSDTMIEASEY